MRRMARGEGKAGCVFYLLLLLIVGFLALKVVPVQVDKMQLQDYMKELAMTSPRKNGDWFRERIMVRAKNMDLPLQKKNVKINKGARRVVMDVKYTVVLDLMVTEYPMEVEIHLDREIFLF